MAYNLGNTLFTGDYVNPNVPLWLSASSPITSPANITVSSMTVSPVGGIIMKNDGVARPNTAFGSIIFDRLPDRFDTYLKQNISKQVPNFPDDREYLSVTAVFGLQYDDLAVSGIQLFGFQPTSPAANTGCAGRLSKGSLPFSVRLDTAVFETNNVKGNVATFSSINLSSVAASISTFSTLTASTINAGLITASTLNVSSLGFPAVAISSLSASTINAGIITASSLSVSSLTFPAVAISSLSASTINAGVLTASSLNVSSFTLPNTLVASTLTAAQGNFSTLIADNGSISSLNVSSLVAGNVSTNVENVNQAYVSSLTAPNIVAVTTQTTDLIAGTVFSASIRATAPTAFVSTGNVVAPNIFTSAISTNNINASTFNTSLMNATVANISTLNVINFSTISTNSLAAGSISTPFIAVSSIAGGNVTATNVTSLNVLAGNVSSLNVSTNSIYANVATFSTLNAPSGSVTVSTVNTGLVSTSVAVVKDIFMSSMVFNASLSPNFNIDMGGIVGGLIGYAGANTLGIGLGAVNLATGIASLAQGRQSGGINSNIFQTINGTSQLQYSTLGTATQTTFVNTDSALPNNVQGNIVYTSTFISSGTYCMRTISDPLNLANSAGIAGQGIQGFSEWTPVYPGFLTVRSVAGSPAQTAFFDSASQSLINFGGNPTQSTLTMFSPNRVRVVSSNAVDINGASTVTITASTININSGFPVSTVSVNLSGNLTATSTIQSRQLNVSTISGGTFPVNIIPGILTSTLAVSSLTIGTSVTGSVSVSTLVSLGSTQLSVTGLSSFGVTVGCNATAPIDGNSLSVKGNVSIGSGFDVVGGGNVFGTFSTGDDATLGFLPSSIVSLAPSGGTITLGSPGANVSSSSTTVFGSTITNSLNSLSGGWMNPIIPIAPTIGGRGNMVLAGVRFAWGIASPSVSPLQTGFAFNPVFSAPPLVFIQALYNDPYGTGSPPTSYGSISSITAAGFTALTYTSATVVSTPTFAAYMQFLAIGPS